MDVSKDSRFIFFRHRGELGERSVGGTECRWDGEWLGWKWSVGGMEAECRWDGGGVSVEALCLASWV